MKSKKISFLSILMVLFVSLLLFTIGFVDKNYDNPNTIFQIYLDGEKIGLIDNKEEFFNLINKEQVSIKNKYNVDQVYPPKGFEIIPYKTYDGDIIEPSKIYDNIKNERDFTVKGFIVTIKPKEKDKKKKEEKNIKVINVLDKKVFEEALHKFVYTFVKKDTYDNYLKDINTDYKEIGENIDNIYFDNIISVKESYINVNDKIYTNSDDVLRSLLYGEDSKDKYYTVKAGDTLSSIAFDNKLNVQEVLIANENISTENSMLAIGQKVNVSPINPVLSLVYDLEVREIIEEPYKVEKKYDSSRYYGYKKVTVPGIKGLSKITNHIRMINGEKQSAAYITTSEIIRKPQNKVIVYGSKYGGGGSIVTPSGESWGLPTKFPYVVTSEYGYRIFKIGNTDEYYKDFHDGIDISGTGYGSPIYAVYEGEVVNAGWGGIAGNSAGYNVVIRHPNGYYTVSAHMSERPLVKVGDYVEQGQHIGKMGHTGNAFGTHLHLGVFVGKPYNGGYPINPRKVILF